MARKWYSDEDALKIMRELDLRNGGYLSDKFEANVLQIGAPIQARKHSFEERTILGTPFYKILQILTRISPKQITGRFLRFSVKNGNPQVSE